MDKIAICGKMASGKTYLAQKMTDERGFQRFSLAGAVKQLGTDYFGMVKKDRPLLQKIGMKMREIRPNVWIDYVVRDIGVHEQECQAVFGTTKGMGVVVDDVRFLNEAKAFKEAGFTLVRLHIEDDLQIERLRNTYGDDADIHIANRHDSSEKEMDEMDDSLFDVVLTAANDDSVYESLHETLFGTE
tara:strand:- start:1012 stop:1572 length:561 start_codon:yes stop_codon:yes gene_type:complete